MTTIQDKVQLTVSVDHETRKLFEKYGGHRGIGKLLQALIRKHDMEETYGTAMIVKRLERIDARLVELLDRDAYTSNG